MNEVEEVEWPKDSSVKAVRPDLSTFPLPPRPLQEP